MTAPKTGVYVCHCGTNIAAMVPQSAYGSTAEQALNSAASQHGLQIVAMDRYPRNSGAVSATSQAVAGKVANPTNNIQGLFLPEGSSMLAAAANALLESSSLASAAACSGVSSRGFARGTGSVAAVVRTSPCSRCWRRPSSP